MDIKEDIKLFVTSYIKDINIVDEILKTKHINFKNFYVSNSDIIDIHKLYNEFYKLKKNLQLLLNSIYHYEIFKNCILQTNDTAVIQNNGWQEEEIIELVYNFIKCFTTLQFVENQTLKEKSCSEFDLYISYCTMCNSVISLHDIKCSICEEPVVINYKRKQTENDDDNNVNEKKRTKTIKDKNGNLECVGNVNVTRNHIPDCSVDVHKYTNNAKLLSNNVDKWLCSECTCLNDYKSGLCDACGKDKEEFGVWCCDSCTYRNKMKVNTCEVCYQINKLINLKSETKATKKSQWDHKKPNKTKNKKENWQCYCKTLHSIDENHICDPDSISPNSRTDCNIKRSNNGSNIKSTTKQKAEKRKNEHNEFNKLAEANKTTQNENWSCEKCTLINDMRSMKCFACDTKHISNKKNTVKLDTDSDKKICWYKNCRKEIQTDGDFCPHCKISIQGSYDKNAEVFKMFKNTKTAVWVCSNCDKCNKKTDDKCANKSCEKLQF